MQHALRPHSRQQQVVTLDSATLLMVPALLSVAVVRLIILVLVTGMDRNRSRLCVAQTQRGIASSVLQNAARTENKFAPNIAYFVLFQFRIYVFIETAALRSIVFRYYARAPKALRNCCRLCFFCFCFFFVVLWGCCSSPSILYRCKFQESTSYVFSFWLVFFFLVTSSWIFLHQNISLSALFAPESLVSRDGFGSPVSR